ncbi:G-type lectin S-receptor-like serine/threonine-protein kinase At1g61500 [Malania oleifera]|uniref:G-type lectin S-receptor-like serine/threonine-protein kinase At1g61500 n=1 Tax=Malania oleifera TaxID=397392 RepID=UPI0025ADF715|nr:G-type lectin S-receptor-like serine/threonine-protein kinase At1g61500 [Malania oleifera]
MGVDGNLRLMGGNLNTVWSTNVVWVLSNKLAAVLFDNGNIVIEDTVKKEKLWESMNNPCDTFLLGMKLGMNAKTGQKQLLTSWKSEYDPSPGNFIPGTTMQVPPQPFIRKGTTFSWRGGPWNGLKFIGMPDLDIIYQNRFCLVSDTQGTEYFTFNALEALI